VKSACFLSASLPKAFVIQGANLGSSANHWSTVASQPGRPPGSTSNFFSPVVKFSLNNFKEINRANLCFLACFFVYFRRCAAAAFLELAVNNH
jgi:hypothetical protein